MEIAYVTAGLAVGLAVGFTGIGGGSLMTPILVLFFGLPASIAVGTDLLYASLTKMTGVCVYARKGVVRWRVVVLLLAGSVPGSLLTIALLRQVFAGLPVDQLINSTLGFALILTAVALLFQEQLRAVGRRRQQGAGPRQVIRARRDYLTAFLGLVLGVLVTLSSIGAGAIGTVILIALYPSLPIVAIIGTELAHAVILSAVAGIGHWQLGTVDFSLLGLLLIGSIPGVYVGSHLGVRVPECYVRPALAGALLFIGLRFAL